jgi:hypothetical protein
VTVVDRLTGLGVGHVHCGATRPVH